MGLDAMASIWPFWGFITMTAPSLAGGCWLPLRLSTDARSEAICPARSASTAFWSPVSMLSTTVSPVWGAVCDSVPATSPPALTSSTCLPLTPLR